MTTKAQAGQQLDLMKQRNEMNAYYVATNIGWLTSKSRDDKWDVSSDFNAACPFRTILGAIEGAKDALSLHEEMKSYTIFKPAD